MSRNRQLLRTNFSSVSVAGMIPISVFSHNKNKIGYGMTDQDCQCMSIGTCGGIDLYTVRFAYIICTNNMQLSEGYKNIEKCHTDPATLKIWRHVTYSLSEDLIPSEVCAEVFHPEYTNHKHKPPLDRAYIAFVPISIHENMESRYLEEEGANQSITRVGMYWSSPDGVVCYYLLKLPNSLSPPPIPYTFKCLTSSHLSLMENEHVTSITCSCASESSLVLKDGLRESLLIGTSMGNIWICRLSGSIRNKKLHSRRLHMTHNNKKTHKEIWRSLYKNFFTYSNKVNRDRDSIISLLSLESLLSRPVKSRKLTHTNGIGRKVGRNTNVFFAVSINGTIETWTLMFNSRDFSIIEKNISTLDLNSSLRNCIAADESLSGMTLDHMEVLSVSIELEGLFLVLMLRLVFGINSASGRNEKAEKKHCRFYLVIFEISSSRYNLTLEKIIRVEVPNSIELDCSGILVYYRKISSDDQKIVTVYSVWKKCQRRICLADSTYKNGNYGDIGSLSLVTVLASRISLSTTENVLNETLVLNLPADTIPSVVNGMVTKDTRTDGCVLVCSTGIVAELHFTFPSLQQNRTECNFLVNDSTCDLVRHLLFYFNAYCAHHHNSNKRHYGKIFDLEDIHHTSSLPQTVLEADNISLSYAVASACVKLSDDFQFTKFEEDCAIKVVCRKFQTHNNFLKFLSHSGIYKRINFLYRIILRDIGEKVFTLGELLTSWQIQTKNLRRIRENKKKCRGIKMDTSTESDIKDDVVDLEMVTISDGLEEMRKSISNLPYRLKDMQNRLLLSHINEELSYDTMLFPKSLHFVTHLLCSSIKYIYTFRELKSGILYDLPSHCSSWKCVEHSKCLFNPQSNVMLLLDLIEIQLSLIHKAVSITGDQRSLVYIFRNSVKLMAIFLLNEYRNIEPNERDEARYNNAKELTISLLQVLSSGNSDDDLIFRLSLEHAYFRGVVEKSHDHKEKCVFTSCDIDAVYDMNVILSSYPSCKMIDGSPYVFLYLRSDHITDFSFQEFVFRWYSDRKLYGNILMLGKNCPEILSQYMERDEILLDLRWIHFLMMGSYSKASSCLVSLASKGREEIKDKSVLQKLFPLTEDKDLAFSLSKLAALSSDDVDIKMIKFLDDNI